MQVPPFIDAATKTKIESVINKENLIVEEVTDIFSSMRKNTNDAIDKNRIMVNGLYRHGFLIAPALAELTLAYVERGQIDNEVMRCA